MNLKLEEIVLLLIMWLLPIALLLIRRRQLLMKRRQRGINRYGLYHPGSDWADSFAAGCIYGCMNCRGQELPCLCPCEHHDPPQRPV
ncbi:MAG TPA: hypothetical protein VJN01_09895 [Xanthomonadales bacterium]|nr:hypothetical protein [Xanthomonadales bacterium]